MKTKNHIKLLLPELSTRDAAETCMTQLALASNHRRQLLADRDAAVLEIHERCGPELSRLDEQIQQATTSLKRWAEANPEQFPKGLKSVALSAGRVGFRTGTPKLAPLTKTWTWEKITRAVQTLLPTCIRSRPEIDRETILGQRAQLADVLPRVGLRVIQSESFFVEPDLAQTEARKVAKAA